MPAPRPVPSFLAPFVKLHEGFVPRAAPDPDGYSSIGYGHKLGPTDPLRTVTLTEAQGDHLLTNDLDEEATMLCAVSPQSIIQALSEGQYAALVDFVFNEGIGRYRTSDLRQAVETRSWGRVPDELARWRFGNGRVLPGLVARRADEAAMWLGHYPPTKAV